MLQILTVLALCGLALGAPAPSELELNYNVSVDHHYGIVGGVGADISQFPWMVSVQYLNQHFCGGFLISANWVVTAAHCITQGYSNNLNIRAGSSLRGSGGVSVAVSGYIVHPNYRDSTLDNDIALLRLTSNVNAVNARAASLPTAGQVIPDGASLTITGWGAVREGGASSASLLQVSVPTINQAVCRNRYASSRSVTDNMFCAGLLDVGGKDSCQGDSGGPAVVNGQVVGIVSWGAGCARPAFPGVYARIANLRTWIRTNTGV